jgi:hypothetical protein
MNFKTIGITTSFLAGIFGIGALIAGVTCIGQAHEMTVTQVTAQEWANTQYRSETAGGLEELKHFEYREYTGSKDNKAAFDLYKEGKDAAETENANNIELAKLGLECYDEGTTGFNHAMRVTHCGLKVGLVALEKHFEHPKYTGDKDNKAAFDLYKEEKDAAETKNAGDRDGQVRS